MQDLNNKVTGGTLTAAEWNEVPSEIQNVIEALGIVLSTGDLNQLGKAIAGYAANGDFYTDSGGADAYVLATVGAGKQAPPSYLDGMVIRFIADNANTGASTVNVAALGVKSITDQDGNALAAGALAGSVEAVFDNANDRFELLNTGVTNLVVVTASGNYDKPTGLKAAEALPVGAGGGGGGVDGQGAGTFGAGGGGGAGGWTRKIYLAANLAASEPIVIGAGGAGGTGSGGNAGAAGGSTTFKGLTATGGNGVTTALGIIASTTQDTRRGGNGGSGSGGDVNGDGGPGHPGLNLSLVDAGAYSGSGGSSILGGGAKGRGSDLAGDDAVSFGGGGSGGAVSNVTTDFDGGDGADGVVIIKEFF